MSLVPSMDTIQMGGRSGSGERMRKEEGLIHNKLLVIKTVADVKYSVGNTQPTFRPDRVLSRGGTTLGVVRCWQTRGRVSGYPMPWGWKWLQGG